MYGALLELEKRVAPRELFTIRIDYAAKGRDAFPQTVSISQAGRCNLKDSYIKAKAAELLAELGIEAEWMETALVELSYIN